jgi:hypothetical protein
LAGWFCEQLYLRDLTPQRLGLKTNPGASGAQPGIEKPLPLPPSTPLQVETLSRSLFKQYEKPSSREM